MAPRPTEAALELLHQQLKDYPEHGRNLARYPPPRKRRGGALTEEEAAAGILGGMPASGGDFAAKVWPFRVRTAAINTRATVVSGPLNGPAIVTDALLLFNLRSTVTGGVSLFYSTDNDGNGIGQALTSRPTGSPILMEASVAETAALDADQVREHFHVELNNTAFGRPVPYRIGVMVPVLGRFYLKVSIHRVGNESPDIAGMIRVLEGPSIEALRARL